MKNFKMKKLLAIILSISLLALAGCSPGGDNNSEGLSTLERVQKEGKIVVGFANEKPYAYKTSDGEVTGMSVEVARAIFKELGINEVEGKVTEFGSLIPGLKAGRFDVVTAGMYITPKRAEQVAFADPEYRVGQGLAVSKGNPHNLHSYQDIANNPDISVAVMAGGFELDYLKASGVKESQIQVVNDIPSCISALESGRVDATTMTDITLQSALQTADQSKLQLVMDFEQPIIEGQSVIAHGAAAFNQADTDFVAAYNAELQKLKESGKLLEILKKFGFSEQNLPADITTEQIIAES
ncbi:ectoine/hydroxyectoine ABC transporter substrate-binding protein EhuB [Peptococcaceae bacterium 1198_IL3148]